jgi:hypothetical protein
MIDNEQRYEVTVKLTYAAEVFAGDPDDVFELAEQEKTFVRSELESVFGASGIITELNVVPVLGE